MAKQQVAVPFFLSHGKMASSRECIRPDTYIFLRLPSELLKLVEINSNT